MANDKSMLRLRCIADEDNAAPNRRYAAIIDAFAEGHSRREIAEALGITRQSLDEFIARRERRPS